MAVSFGNLKPATKAEGKSKMIPIVQVPKPLASKVDEVCKLDSDIKLKTAEADVIKADLLQFGEEPFYVEAKANPELSSVRLQGVASNVLMIVSSRVKGEVKPEEVAQIVGANRAKQWFIDTVSLKIDFDKIPENLKQKVADQIVTVLNNNGCADAGVVVSKTVPVEAYWTARCSLPVKTLLALDRVAVPTKYIKV